MPTGVFGVITVGAGPASGMDTPCPTAKSLVPPLHVTDVLLAVVAHVIEGGVNPPR